MTPSQVDLSEPGIASGFERQAANKRVASANDLRVPIFAERADQRRPQGCIDCWLVVRGRETELLEPRAEGSLDARRDGGLRGRITFEAVVEVVPASTVRWTTLALPLPGTAPRKSRLGLHRLVAGSATAPAGFGDEAGLVDGAELGQSR